VHEIARKYPREKNRYSSFSDSVGSVLDFVSQIRDVVLVRCILTLETPGGRDFGMGREWGGDGNGEISLRATWDHGGQDPITARRVPSK
jgi:hypothetical protein